MKLKMCVTLTPNGEQVNVITNLLCIAEWERTEGRKISDGRGIGASDMVAWAFFMFKQSGRLIKEATWKEWLQTYPDMSIDLVDVTDPNPIPEVRTDAS